MTGDFTKALQACLDYRARIDHLEKENTALRTMPDSALAEMRVLDEVCKERDALQKENAALRASHAALYLALGNLIESDHTKWPEAIKALRAENAALRDDLATLNAERAEAKELRKQWAAECDANAALRQSTKEATLWRNVVEERERLREQIKRECGTLARAQLEDEVGRLRKALTPFAKAADLIDEIHMELGTSDVPREQIFVSLKDCREARVTLEKKP